MTHYPSPDVYKEDTCTGLRYKVASEIHRRESKGYSRAFSDTYEKHVLTLVETKIFPTFLHSSSSAKTK